MMVLFPQHFSVFLHLALRFWNQTCGLVVAAIGWQFGGNYSPGC